MMELRLLEASRWGSRAEARMIGVGKYNKRFDMLLPTVKPSNRFPTALKTFACEQTRRFVPCFEGSRRQSFSLRFLRSLLLNPTLCLTQWLLHALVDRHARLSSRAI